MNFIRSMWTWFTCKRVFVVFDPNCVSKSGVASAVAAMRRRQRVEALALPVFDINGDTPFQIFDIDDLPAEKFAILQGMIEEAMQPPRFDIKPISDEELAESIKNYQPIMRAYTIPAGAYRRGDKVEVTPIETVIDPKELL